MTSFVDDLVPRLTVVADRETFNLESVISNSNRNPNDFRLSAILTPFSELDPEIIDLIDRVSDMRQNGTCIPLDISEMSSPFLIEGIPSPFDGTFDRNLHFFSTDTDINYIHVPYKKGMSEAERLIYSVALLQVLQLNRPDVVFLSNFKAILDGIIPTSLPYKIVNVHPSVLPYNKGWRTEKKALDGINPHASGYTFHAVVPEIDEGPTLFQQKVSLEGHTEESLRLATIIAQSHWTPQVLKLYASGRPVAIVKGMEAFKVENRESEYDGSEEHQKYSRMLFKTGIGQYVTMEKILGAPEYAAEQKVEAVSTYRFNLDETGLAAQRKFGGLITKVQSTGGLLKSRYLSDAASRKWCQIQTLRNIGPILDSEGIKYEVVHSPVSVNAPILEIW
ncbi:MAG TPA: formyltransferase family protein [Candidatus Nanoarchaeia archaeon]|nr:formyltransferase family protein [Candidatus Nanoarchaeia archaeon]